MARLKKEDHARILHLVDVEHRAVREIAAEFGCTAANIYSLLAKLRRGAEMSGDATAKLVADGEAGLPNADPAQSALGLEARLSLTEPERNPQIPVAILTDTAPERPAVPAFAVVSAVRGPVSPPPALAEPMPERRPVLGARLSKPGIGLVMRTEDGEETMTPFRSVDDLLSAIKPLLRATARNPDPVWFSLQPVDLSAIDVDAA